MGPAHLCLTPVIPCQKTQTLGLLALTFFTLVRTAGACFHDDCVYIEFCPPAASIEWKGQCMPVYHLIEEDISVSYQPYREIKVLNSASCEALPVYLCYPEFPPIETEHWVCGDSAEREWQIHQILDQKQPFNRTLAVQEVRKLGDEYFKWAMKSYKQSLNELEPYRYDPNYFKQGRAYFIKILRDISAIWTQFRKNLACLQDQTRVGLEFLFAVHQELPRNIESVYAHGVT